MLVTARENDCQYVWNAHAASARAAGVPNALVLAGSLGCAARVAEAVKLAAALPRGGALAVPGAAEGLAGAVGVAPPLGAGALLANKEALEREETEVDTVLEGGSEAEGQGVPLLLPVGDPEGRALRDGDSEARGEEESRGVPVCCAAVPLCVRDAAELPVAAALRSWHSQPVMTSHCEPSCAPAA